MRVMAPEYALLGAADALRKYVALGVIGAGDAAKALSILSEFDIDFVGLEKGMVAKALKYSL